MKVAFFLPPSLHFSNYGHPSHALTDGHARLEDGITGQGQDALSSLKRKRPASAGAGAGAATCAGVTLNADGSKGAAKSSREPHHAVSNTVPSPPSSPSLHSTTSSQVIRAWEGRGKG